MLQAHTRSLSFDHHTGVMNASVSHQAATHFLPQTLLGVDQKDFLLGEIDSW